jgi:hypothetical protein
MLLLQNARQCRLFFYLTATALLALGAVSSPARADEVSRFKVEIAPGVRWLSLPEIEGGLEAPNLPVGASPDDAVGWGIDGRLGYRLDGDLSPLGPATVAVRLRTTFADADAETLTTTGSYGQMPVNGPGPSNGSGGVSAFSSVDYDRYDVDLVYQVAVDVPGPVAVRPLLGFAYSRIDQRYKFRAAPSNGFEIRDDIDSNYYGVVLGVEGEAGLPVEGLSLDLGFELGLLALDSQFNADQSFGGIPLSADDDRTDFAWRTRGVLGLRWTFLECLSIGAEGTVDWERIHVPKHALFESDPFESKLETEDAVVLGGNLTLSVVF